MRALAGLESLGRGVEAVALGGGVGTFEILNNYDIKMENLCVLERDVDMFESFCRLLFVREVGACSRGSLMRISRRSAGVTCKFHF